MGFFTIKPWQREHDDSEDLTYTANQIVAYTEDDFRAQQKVEDDAGKHGRQLGEDDLDEYLWELRDHDDYGAIRDAVSDRLGWD